MSVVPLKKLLVLAGPSGVGKGTLLKRLIGDFPYAFGFSVSHTSRHPRVGEVNGKDYFFETNETILDLVKQSKFLEHAFVHGNVYGTSLGEVERVSREGRICVIEIDLQGVKQIQASSLATCSHFIFVTPPSLTVLETRLRQRGTENADKIKKRVETALSEINAAQTIRFDLNILNDHLDDAYRTLRTTVLNWYPGILSTS